MTDFVVTITDPDQLAGITWAREQYNASLPPPPPPMGTLSDNVEVTMDIPTQQSADVIQTDEEYVQWVMEQAAISYADQKLRKEYQQHYENAVGSQSAARKTTNA